jgi:DNA-binding winged helix-turn-helix (wHTH) protein/TolB-like protein
MSERAFVIGRFTLQPDRQLLRGAVPVAIGVKTLKVLAALVETPGELVTKDELMARVWPGMIVEENTLQAHISALRKVLGEDARWIATVPGRGYRFAGPKEGTTEAEPAAPRRRGLALVAGVVLAVLLAAGFAVERWLANLHPAAQPTRYMVLPFSNRTGDPRNDNIADQLTDETAAQLAAKAWDASVVAHSEALALKGQPMDEAALGRRLGLDYVVEGSLLPSEAGIEAVAMLIDGQSGTHLATSRATQPTARRRWLAATVTDQLLASVAGDRRRRLKASSDDDGSARNLLDRASIGFNDERIGDGWTRPLALVDRALVLEPRNPRARYLAGSARTELAASLVYRTDAERDRLLDQAEQALGEAARIEPNRPAIHLALGDLRVVQGRHDSARAEFERVRELDMTDEHAISALAMEELYDGHPERALPMLEEAKPISATNMYYVYGTVAQVRLHLDEDAEALEALRHAMAVDSEDPWAWTYLVGLLQLNGRTGELPAALAQVKVLSPGLTIARLRTLDAQTSPSYQARQERFYAALQVAGVPTGESDGQPDR